VRIEINGTSRGRVLRDDDATFLVMPISLPG
jgi:hypothetical protein